MLRSSTTCWLLELLCALALPLAAVAAGPISGTEPGMAAGLSTATGSRLATGSPLAHITVDKDRFGRTSGSPNPQSTVARQSYLDTISRFHSHFARPKLSWLKNLKPYPHLA